MLKVYVGALLQIVHHQPSHSPPHSDAVVGASVFGVYLGGVGEIHALEGGAVAGDVLGVVDSDDGLGAVDSVVVAGLDPRRVKVRVYLSEVGQVLVQQFLPFHPGHWVIGGQVVGQIDDVLAAVVFWADEVGVLDNSDEWDGAVSDVEPVDMR